MIDPTRSGLRADVAGRRGAHVRRAARSLAFVAVVVMTATILVPPGPAAAAPAVTRESVSGTEAQAVGDSDLPSISANGRYVVFQSAAGNLIPGDTNGQTDVFLRDRQTGTTTRVSVSGTGAQANAWAIRPALSASGRQVAFISWASNLVPGGTHDQSVFLRDLDANTTERIDVSSAGTPGVGGANVAAVSGDGRFVLFWSLAENLVPGDTNRTDDVFLRDRATGTTERVNLSSTGAQANHFSYPVAMTPDARYVVFRSYASNLVPGDTNNQGDEFVRDRLLGTTERINLSNEEGQANGGFFNEDFGNYQGQISNNGRYVLFMSSASNLVPGDTNQKPDVFLRDRTAGTTTRISLAGNGSQANDRSDTAKISPDGKYVVFTSAATNLVPGDTNAVWDVFIRCRSGASTIRRISVNAADQQGNLDSRWGAIGGGTAPRVAYMSNAIALVSGDTNQKQDIFSVATPITC